MKPRPIPNYGVIMDLKEFAEACECGSFIDYDGHGRYVKDGMMYGEIYPSHFDYPGVVDYSFKQIIWFNK